MYASVCGLREQGLTSTLLCLLTTSCATTDSNLNMVSPSSGSSPTIEKSCQCRTQLLRGQTLPRGLFRTRHGCHTNQQSSRVALTSAVLRNSPLATSSTTVAKSQPAEQNPRYSSAPRLASAASVNLMQVLAGSAITQGFRQLQSTVDQLQQAGNKLTKGFSPRPLGFPPGAALARHATDQPCLHDKLLSQHR